MNLHRTEPLDARAQDIARALDDWERNEVAAFLKKQAERKQEFFTLGDIPVKRVYTPLDLADTPESDIGLPGRYPFTRGPYPTMYRSRLSCICMDQPWAAPSRSSGVVSIKRFPGQIS